MDETERGEVFIVMAFYPGETLDRVVAHGPLPVARALAVAVQAGRGLAAAHEELIVHRDVKPANLLLTRGDTVKILESDEGPGVPLRRHRRGGPPHAEPDSRSVGRVAHVGLPVPASDGRRP